jgi:hypothetical protein
MLGISRYGAGMAFSLARSAHNATNSLHSLIYFVPETEQQLTGVGQALRAEVEDETDRMAAAPWQHLGDRGTEDVVRIGKAMTRAVLTAGAFPREGVFAAR